MSTIFYIHTSALKISENRQRREFNEESLAKLSNSIIRKGLMHPVVVRKEGEDYFLVAGERRVKAIDMLGALFSDFKCNGEVVPKDCYPCTLLEDLDEIEMEEAELEENVLREDLTWQELAQATARLHELRKKQKAPSGERQTILQTAQEISGDEESSTGATEVSQSLILAQHLQDPDISGAKTRRDALRVLEKKAKREHRANLAETFKAGGGAATSKHTLSHASMEDFCPTVPSGSVQVFVTDPPYAINAQNFGDQVKTEHDYDDAPDKVWPTLERLAQESFRIAAKQAHIYCFCDIVNFTKLADIFRAAGWDVFRTPLIWFKSNGIGVAPIPTGGPRRTYEAILFANKGKRETNFLGLDVLAVPADMQRDHGAQKPVDLYRELIKRSALPGDTVADFFVGSGPIYPAAELENCIAIGCERKESNFNIALERLTKLEKGEEDESR